MLHITHVNTHTHTHTLLLLLRLDSELCAPNCAKCLVPASNSMRCLPWVQSYVISLYNYVIKTVSLCLLYHEVRLLYLESSRQALRAVTYVATPRPVNPWLVALQPLFSHAIARQQDGHGAWWCDLCLVWGMSGLYSWTTTMHLSSFSLPGWGSASIELGRKSWVELEASSHPMILVKFSGSG